MILLLGYGISNKSVEKYLLKNNISYKIFDGFKDEINEVILDNINLIIRSPGISAAHPLLMIAKDKNIEVISEIEFTYRILKKGKLICLTGSNGKTSTLSYAYQILKKYYNDVLFVGNNGVPFSSCIDKIKEDTIILLELSNFQLENTYSLKPFISIITNISENHLDKVANYDEYIKSKLNILNNSENILLNKDDKILKKIKGNNVSYVSSKKNKGYYFKNNDIYFDDSFIGTINNNYLVGTHNKTNLLFVIYICELLNLSIEEVVKEINHIVGVKYRLEYIKTIDGVLIYNDGKSTTPFSCEAAIKSFNKRNIHMILGGRNKGLDFNILSKYKNVQFYAYGEAKYEIQKSLNAQIFNDFKEAYNKINAKKGEIIIFSPGCTSFDQFKDYIERSKAFEDLILSR
ncbi:MAG: UDP-N-acetylmuramoyl-L-alanine--D-glutamate ligase [Bacilli bacterium]|nr:UDP-N-acetylmuramoyl-L-alanine--D-glutamate ligase [Bacilli bacterium]